MYRKFIPVIITLTLSILLNHSAFAATPAAQLTSLLGDLKTMHANFEQVVLDDAGQVMQETSGVMALQRPGKFRWETRKPVKQLLIAASGKVWLYDASLQQVTIEKSVNKGSEITPAFLLTSSVTILSRNFSIKRIIGKQEIWFKLTPKNQQSLFRTVELHFNSGRLVGMRFTDNLGQLSNLIFSQLEYNRSLAASLFRFVTPSGVDVIDQTQA